MSMEIETSFTSKTYENNFYNNNNNNNNGCENKEAVNDVEVENVEEESMIDDDDDDIDDDDEDDDDDDDAWMIEDDTTWFEDDPKPQPSEQEKVEQFVELMVKEDCNLMPNILKITCAICLDDCEQADGVILRNCRHTFCRVCLEGTIRHCEEPLVKCPNADGCDLFLQEREIKALVDPEVYEQYLAKSIIQAENEAGDEAFHCRTQDCPGWAFIEAGALIYLCQVCFSVNCLICQAIHQGKTCAEYQEDQRLNKTAYEQARLTENQLEEMLARGEVMRCPKCGVIITKTIGCDGMTCKMCKTALCWATKGARWGPRGYGDTSGGCRCRVNGQLCHPNCGNCH
ncbi:ranBP-type and C3HC4-type zinc finger-containing protein 1-like [Aphidius gifuensis]|uniref:ranBP-type and C3HC4-type zinc finger-containing protein 1-like n=1 Tax=Aphidius gifuensis TaxID=684658 RepID=UPI001CDD9072|nr:ranBP-type and C3HC4-type zinc finger-containing protein 1-like [Aphidius gifuensis]